MSVRSQSATSLDGLMPPGRSGGSTGAWVPRPTELLTISGRISHHAEFFSRPEDWPLTSPPHVVNLPALQVSRLESGPNREGRENRPRTRRCNR